MNLTASFVAIGLSALFLVSCAPPKNEGATEAALRSRFAQSEFQVVRTLGDRAHPGACGLVHPGSQGNRILYNDIPFIVVGGRAYTPRDVRSDQFLAWGKQFCGADWAAELHRSNLERSATHWPSPP